jgi:hypothetical protein
MKEDEMEGRISRRRFLQATVGGGAVLLAPSWARTAVLPPAANPREDSIVVLWNRALLQGVRESKLGPPMIARALALAHTAAYDAWAAYDRFAVGTGLGGALRQPPAERRLANKSEAISFATYRAGIDLFPGSKATAFDPLMRQLGYDPSKSSGAAAIGIAAAQAVLEFRHRDGSNQLGDEPGGKLGVPYSDYTGFKSVNLPMNMTVPFELSTVVDVNQWQPMQYFDGSGKFVTQEFVGAQWQHVIPFAMASASQLRSRTGPLTTRSPAFLPQHQALVDLSANLTDTQKMIAEYWADGPHSELPPGHWDLFAQFVARRDRHGAEEHGVDLDVKLFFALTNAIFDAGIVAWDQKCAFVGCRPTTAIRVLFYGKQIRSWAGPGLGTRAIPGETWVPFQPATFPTPPFPGYTSGHSNFSAAGAEILRLFTGSDQFGASVTLAAGSSRAEPGVTPAEDVTLSWKTFSDAADQAGLSRRYGGIHIEEDDLPGRSTGRICGRQAWAKAQTYFKGTV